MKTTGSGLMSSVMDLCCQIVTNCWFIILQWASVVINMFIIVMNYNDTMTFCNDLSYLISSVQSGWYVVFFILFIFTFLSYHFRKCDLFDLLPILCYTIFTSHLITNPPLLCIFPFSVVCNESKMVNIDTGKWHWDQLSWNCSVTLLQNVHLIQHSRNNA